MANNILFACGSVHQGDRHFSAESRGRQCIFISLAGLICPGICQHKEMTENMWNSQMVGRIVAFADGQIPDAENLSQSMFHKT